MPKVPKTSEKKPFIQYFTPTRLGKDKDDETTLTIKSPHRPSTSASGKPTIAFDVENTSGLIGEFNCTDENKDTLSAKLGEDSDKWVGHSFTAKVKEYTISGNTRLGWEILPNTVR